MLACVHIEAVVDGQTDLCQLAEFANGCRNQTPLRHLGDNLPALHFEARILCSCFSPSIPESTRLDADHVFLGHAYKDLGGTFTDIAVHVNPAHDVDIASTD